MCGASHEQKDMYAKQSAFYDTMIQQSQEVFGRASAIFKDLQDTFSPILAKGPNQHGFSSGELQTYENQVTNQTGEAYHKASNALNEQLASEGGGNVPILSGANNQLREQLVSSAASQEGAERAQISAEDYATGRQNFYNAASILGSATGVYNPATGVANATTGAGNAAARTANEIAAANNSWVNATIGALGGVAGAATAAEIGKKP